MTKASFDTVAGLLLAVVGLSSVVPSYEAGAWVKLVLYVVLTCLGIWMFSDGYTNLPKNKAMTLQELYDLAVEKGG